MLVLWPLQGVGALTSLHGGCDNGGGSMGCTAMAQVPPKQAAVVAQAP